MTYAHFRHLCFIIVSSTLLLMSSCSSSPIVDLKGVNKAKYEQDLKECEVLANQVKTGENTTKSALVGTLVGGALGAIDGNVGKSAASGAILSTTGGAGNANTEKETVLKNCLKHRGYAVLN